MKNCRFCCSKNIIKHAFIRGKQRYLCKDCKRNQLETDGRKKYEEKIIKMAFILLSEGNNFRGIARILSKIFDRKISYQLVIHWVQNKLNELPEETPQNAEKSNIEIVEMDELFTYFKKNLKTSANMPEYGLLLTATECVCLRLKSENKA